MDTVAQERGRLNLPDIVVLAENHVPLCEARGANFTKLCLAARTLEATGVPVPVEGMKQEPVTYPAPTAGTRLHCGVVLWGPTVGVGVGIPVLVRVVWVGMHPYWTVAGAHRTVHVRNSVHMRVFGCEG